MPPEGRYSKPERAAPPVQVELIMSAQLGRVDGEGNLVFLGNVHTGDVPREAPDTVGTPRVLHSGHGEARQGQAVDEAGLAAAHLDVADGRVLLVQRPHLRRARARVVEP